ncbi:MAG TPA: amidohydrolase family protein [Terriglobia bacterium]|nr:amidohydrolase family protein [Terriglobia bacterium]
MRRFLLVALFLFLPARARPGQAADPSPAAPSLSPVVKSFVTVDSPVFALAHVKVIDGTGAPPLDDQTILVDHGRIESIGPAAATPAPAGAKVMELRGYTVVPGLVGMHDHLVYPIDFASARGPEALPLYGEMGFSFPRLYLACGVTSIRTTGSLDPYTDLELKKWVDEGRLPGPKIHITGPYLEGVGAYTPQMHELSGPDDARRMVEYWAGEGVTSFKAYMHITRAELTAAIEAAHRRGIKVTGHLCSIGFREAAALGIDDLEHGLLVDTEFVPDKKPDACPPGKAASESVAKLDLESARFQDMIHDLVQHHVAVTSTLPVFETFLPKQSHLDERVLDVLAPEARLDYLTSRTRTEQRTGSSFPEEFKKEMQFERMFVKAGGLLLAGEDPTGYGGVLAGFGDQREVELLVEAGFTPVEAIHIASSNGAQFLDESDHIGTLAPGKQADLVLIHGDPAAKIADIEKVDTVFKDGVGYDSAKLIDSVRGVVGRR